MHKIGQPGGFLGRPLGPLLKTGFYLIGNVFEPLPKIVLILLGLAAAATEAAIHKNMFGSGVTILIISNEEVNNIMKIIKSLEESDLLIKKVLKQLKMKQKNKEKGLLSMLLGTLGTSLLGNLLAGKAAIATRQGRGANMPGRGTIRPGEGTIRTVQDF